MRTSGKYRNYDSFRDEIQYLWNTHKSFLRKNGEDITVLNAKLYAQYKINQSNEIKWDIVIVNIPLVFEIVHMKWKDKFEFSDLLQEGLIGASLGVEKYQEGAGSTLVTMIRMYTFKKVSEYVDAYYNSVVIFPMRMVKAIHKATMTEESIDEFPTQVLISYVQRNNPHFPIMHGPDNDDTLLHTKNVELINLDDDVWQFAESHFDIMSMDLFCAYHKKGSINKKRFKDCCASYGITKDKAVEIVNQVHETIKQKYYGIY